MLVFCLNTDVQAQATIINKDKPLRIAVASNFAPTLRKLLDSYNHQQQLFPKPLLVVASSGTLLLQIQHGASFDVFLSADSERPQYLTLAELVVKGSQQTYAYGQLALWSAKPSTELFTSDLFIS